MQKKRSWVWELKQKATEWVGSVFGVRVKKSWRRALGAASCFTSWGALLAVSFVWFLHSWERSDPVQGLVSFILKVKLINKWGGGGKKNKQRVESVLVSAFSLWEVSTPSARAQVLPQVGDLHLAQLGGWNCSEEHSLEAVSEVS